MITPVELRRKGLAILQRELGFVGMVRFLHQFDCGSGSYTRDRTQWLGKPTVDDLAAKIKARRADI